jgi:hypothetical protein
MSENLAEIAEDSARGGFFLFTGNALSYAILAIGSIIIGRLLGPENFGLYSLSLVVPSLLRGLRAREIFSLNSSFVVVFTWVS